MVTYLKNIDQQLNTSSGFSIKPRESHERHNKLVDFRVFSGGNDLFIESIFFIIDASF